MQVSKKRRINPKPSFICRAGACPRRAAMCLSVPPLTSRAIINLPGAGMPAPYII